MLKIEQALARLIAAPPDLAARERLPRCAPGTGPARNTGCSGWAVPDDSWGFGRLTYRSRNLGMISTRLQGR